LRLCLGRRHQRQLEFAVQRLRRAIECGLRCSGRSASGFGSSFGGGFRLCDELLPGCCSLGGSFGARIHGQSVGCVRSGKRLPRDGQGGIG
jgi:hypothetical protein